MEAAPLGDVREMQKWRHTFHRMPELGFEVHSTAATVAELLREFGLDEVHTGIGFAGVVGVLRRGNSDKAIGRRADMDALPIQEQSDNAQRYVV